MRQLPVIVSHYTIDTPYQKEVEKLRTSLERFQLEHWIEGIPCQGSWRANSNWCSRQVQQALQKFPERDILRVDADAVFCRRPDLFESPDFGADVAAHVHDFRWHQNELMGGTMFFRNNERVRVLVDEWAELCCVQCPTHRNGDLLQKLLDRDIRTIRFQPLPATYCKIFDLMKDVRDPVIEHFQASRRFKRQVNEEGAKR